jgi:hypothetical protein
MDVGIEQITICWYKRDGTANWENGIFHQWSQSYEEFDSGPGHFPAAIVEGMDGECHVVYAGHVSFNPDHPDGNKPPSEGSVYEWLKNRSDGALAGPPTWDESMEAECEKAYKEGRARPLQEFIDELKNTRYTLPKRFQPRLINIDGWFAVQVHPEVIELFEGYTYACQVRWIDGEIDCTRGGIPVDQLRSIFKR